MTEPDVEVGRRFVEAAEPPGEVLLCGVTGSHHYGFPSPDSDLDLKGIHLAETRSLLGLDTPRETFDRLEMFEGVECDLTLHEASKALGLLLRGNGNVLERILSPYQLYRSDAVEELRELARGAICRRFFDHYRGYFTGMRREHEREDPPRAKSLLYSYRVALTGAHLLRTGDLVADLRVTAPEHGFDDILEVVELKTQSREKATLEQDVDARHRARWPDLERALREAHDASGLPDEPPNRGALSDWLVRMRMARLPHP